MKKKMLCHILLLVLLLIFTGCSDDKVNSSDNEVVTEIEDTAQGNNGNDDGLTIEYVCEKYNMDESEFDGVDFDAFVDYYGLTKDNMGAAGPKYLLEKYKELKYKVKIPEYSKLTGNTDTFLDEYKEHIEVVIIEEIEEAGSEQSCNTLVLDFALGYELLSHKPLSSSGFSEEDIVKEIDDDIKNQIVDCINNSDLCNLEKQSVDTASEQAEGYQPSATKLLIKMNDGTVYGISYIETDNPADEEKQFFDFINDIKKLVE